MWSLQTLELIWHLAKTDFKLRYVGSHLGYLWAVLKPFLLFIVIHTFFSHFFFHQISNYSLHLLLGLILWTYFTESSKNSLETLTNNANILKKAQVSKAVLIIAATVSPAITLGINLLIATTIILYNGLRPSLTATSVAIMSIGLLYCLTAGVGLAAAALHVRYRDIGQLWDLVLRLSFFATPIIYPLAALPEIFHAWLWINPPGYLIQITKMALLSNVLPSWQTAMGLSSITLITLALSVWLFRVQRHTIADYL